MENKLQHDPVSNALHAAYYDLSRAVMMLERETLTLDDVRQVRQVVGAAGNKLIALDALMAPLAVAERKRNELLGMGMPSE